MLRRRGLPLERLLVLAWSPLALVEIAGSGHNEAFGMLWLVLALLALDADRPLLSALAAAAGFMTKYLPGLVAAAWARRYRWWHVLAGVAPGRRRWSAPYLDASSRKTMLLQPLEVRAVLAVQRDALRPARRRSWDRTRRRCAPARVLSLVLALALAWRRTEPVAAATAVVVASLLLAPNVLPWYALWLLPLLVVRDEPAALLFTGTVSLAYLVYPDWQSGEPWRLGWGWRALEYGPCALVAARGWTDRRPDRTAQGLASR